MVIVLGSTKKITLLFYKVSYVSLLVSFSQQETYLLDWNASIDLTFAFLVQNPAALPATIRENVKQTLQALTMEYTSNTLLVV